MRFMQQLWQGVKPIFNKTIKHPFAQKLSKGTLELSAFQAFLAQDVLYLQAYAQTLTLLAEKTQFDVEKTTWLNFATDTRKLINTFEQNYFPQYAVSPAESLSRACSEYTNFLLDTAQHSSYPETLAVISPCFVFYYEVGKTIAANSVLNNPYANWITSYNCAFFANDVQKVKALINQAALASDPTTRKNMQKLFTTACEFEWAFMECTYQQAQINTSIAYISYSSFWQKQTSNKLCGSLATISKALP